MKVNERAVNDRDQDDVKGTRKVTNIRGKKKQNNVRKETGN